MILTQRVKNLEKSLKSEQIKLKPRNDIHIDNIDAIMKSANIAMDRFNKRINDES